MSDQKEISNNAAKQLEAHCISLGNLLGGTLQIEFLPLIMTDEKLKELHNKFEARIIEESPRWVKFEARKNWNGACPPNG